MIENNYIKKEILEKEYSNKFLKLEDILTSCIKTIGLQSSIKHADILRAIKAINDLSKELNIEVITKKEIMDNLEHNKMYTLLLEKLNDILHVEHNNSYDEFLGIHKNNKLKKEDFNKIKDLLAEVKELIESEDIEEELKEKFLKDIDYIINNLKNDEKEISKTRGLIVGIVEKVDGTITEVTVKSKIKKGFGKVFQVCGEAIKNIKPDNINISLININNKNEMTNEDVIDVVVENNDLLEN